MTLIYNILDVRNMVKTKKTNLPTIKEQKDIVNIIDFLLAGKGKVSSLNELKSTITVSLGTKKKLDSINNNKLSYDNLITDLVEKNNYLLEEIKLLKQGVAKSKIQAISLKLTEYARKNEIIRYSDFIIVYSYNKYVGEQEDFEFYINIDKIRYKGNEIDKKQFYRDMCIYLGYYGKLNSDKLAVIVGEMVIYFTILTELIKRYFNKSFKVSTDLASEPKYWEYTLGKIKLPEKVLSEDVMDKVESFQTSIEHYRREMTKPGDSKNEN